MRFIYTAIGLLLSLFAQGQFQTPYLVQTLEHSYARTELMDFDGDGDLDVILETDTSVAVSEQVAPLQFVEHHLFENVLTSFNLTDIFNTWKSAKFVDLNGDGLLDFIRNGDSGLEVNYNLGNYNFSETIELVHYEGVPSGGLVGFSDSLRHKLFCSDFVVEDLDDDGNMELLVAEVQGEQGASDVVVYYPIMSYEFVGENLISSIELIADYTSSFGLWRSEIFFGGELNYGVVKLLFDRDLDGDSDLDLIIGVSAGQGSFFSYRFFENGQVQSSSAAPLQSTFYLTDNMFPFCELVNLDNDIDLECVSVGFAATYMNLADLRPGMQYSLGMNIPESVMYRFSAFLTGVGFVDGVYMVDCALADANSDGITDFVYTQSNGFIAMAISDGNLGFWGSTEVVGSGAAEGIIFNEDASFFSGLDSLKQGKVADVDGDGFLDLLLYRANQLFLMSGNPNFSIPSDPVIDINTFIDFDGNGILNGNDYVIPSSLRAHYETYSLYIDSDSEVYFSSDSLIVSPVGTNPNFQWHPEFLVAYRNSAEDTLHLDFGLVPLTLEDSVSMHGTLTGSCSWMNLDLYLDNGATPLSGTLDLVLSSFGLDYSIVDWESNFLNAPTIVGDTLRFAIADLVLAQSGMLHYEFHVPLNANTIGQVLFVEAIPQLYNTSGEPLDAGTFYASQMVTCAYDPNYKEVQEGYTENNYVFDGSWLNYTVHFQNTGNAPASLVYIEDQLSADLDWSTLQPLNSSHDFTATLSDNGMVEFRFENINLPDSTSDLEGSQGYVSYRIKLRDGLNAFTQVQNTAAIYFDANEPIITNTTTNTIYYCSDLEQNEVLLQPLCANETFEGTNNATWVESIGWSYQAQTSASESFVFSATESAPLVMELSNALCQYTESWNVEVDAPVASFTIDGNTLTASEGASYEWFVMNGETVSSTGITTQSFEVTQSGMYAVLVTNANGCSAYSGYQTIEISSVGEKGEEALVVYPNPARDMLVVALKSSDYGKIMRIVDCTGRVVLTEGTITKNQMQLDVSSLSAGIYTVCFGEQKALFVKE